MADSGKPYYLTEQRLQIIGGDQHEFLVNGFTYEEELNESYTLTINCRISTAVQQNVVEAVESRRGKDMEFFLRRQFPDGELLETRICGVVSSMERITFGEPGKGPTNDEFLVTIVPAWELLKHERTGGTWHNRSYADILVEELQKGLAGHKRTVERKLTGNYPAIDFTVRRPDESLYDFSQKLMRRTGINYLFDHAAGVEVMVLVDANASFPKGNRRGSVPFAPQWSENNPTDDEEGLIRVFKAAPTPPRAQRYKNFDIEAPQMPVEGLADFSAFSKAAGGGEIVVHEGLRPNENDPAGHVERRAKLEQEVIGTKANDLDFETTITGSLAGRRFEIEANPGDIREFIVAKVSASGTNFDLEPGDYLSRVKFIATSSERGTAVPVRPVKDVDEGHHFGVYRAEIIAIQNDPVDVDGLLRCRLKFPWDEQTADLKTTYVSVLQPMGGTHGGTQWFPRAGDRCLVMFIGGHHEQPVIVGCLYDAELKPPQMGPARIVLPEASSWLGWNHSSIGDKARQTMLSMKLDAGDELMYFNAPWDWEEEIGNDCRVSIGRDETRNVGRDFDEQIGGSYNQRVTMSRTEDVGINYTLDVGLNYSRSTRGLSDITVTGMASETYHMGKTVEVMAGGVTETIMAGARTEMVLAGARTFTVPAGIFAITSGTNVTITAPLISLVGGVAMGMGGSGPAAGGALDISSKATLKGPVSASLLGGTGEVKTDKSGVSVQGPATTIKDQMGGSAEMSNGKYTVDAPQGIEFRCGDNTLRMAPDGIYINGSRLEIEAEKTELRTTAFDIVGPQPNVQNIASVVDGPGPDDDNLV